MNARRLVLLGVLLGAACRDRVAEATAALAAADPVTRGAGIRGLAGAGPAAAGAVPALVAATADDAMADVAVWALGEIGPAAAPALPQLLALPVEGRPLRQLAVCLALAKIGGRRADVIERLQRDVASPHAMVRQAARGALRSLQ